MYVYVYLYIYVYLCISMYTYIYIHVCVVCFYYLILGVPEYPISTYTHASTSICGTIQITFQGKSWEVVSRHRDIFWHCVHLLSPVLILSKSPKLGQHLQPEATLWLARIYAYVCASVQIMQSLIKELLQQAGYSSISPSQKIQKC